MDGAKKKQKYVCDGDVCRLVDDDEPEIKTVTTCCACPECTCGESCTCTKGTINCDPCQKHVDENKNK